MAWDLAVQTGAVTTPLLIDPEAIANYHGVLPVVVDCTTAAETITIAANGANTDVSSDAGGGTTTYDNTSDGLQVNGGATGTNTFNLNGSGYTNGDVVNVNANPHGNNFTYLEANSDGVDHIRLLGNNIFGFEDLPSGGDRDFNDIIVKVTLKA